jgi:hypothetical protein
MSKDDHELGPAETAELDPGRVDVDVRVEQRPLAMVRRTHDARTDRGRSNRDLALFERRLSREGGEHVARGTLAPDKPADLRIEGDHDHSAPADYCTDCLMSSIDLGQ